MSLITQSRGTKTIGDVGTWDSGFISQGYRWRNRKYGRYLSASQLLLEWKRSLLCWGNRYPLCIRGPHMPSAQAFVEGVGGAPLKALEGCEGVRRTDRRAQAGQEEASRVAMIVMSQNRVAVARNWSNVPCHVESSCACRYYSGHFAPSPCSQRLVVAARRLSAAVGARRWGCVCLHRQHCPRGCETTSVIRMETEVASINIRAYICPTGD